MKSYANNNQVHRVTIYDKDVVPISTLWSAIEKSRKGLGITHEITVRNSPPYGNADFIKFGMRRFNVMGLVVGGAKDQLLTFNVEEIK